MEINKETSYKGFVLNGFFALVLTIALMALVVYFFYRANNEGILRPPRRPLFSS
jgi:hypothetical protein